jgi:hypothetical protein
MSEDEMPIPQIPNCDLCGEPLVPPDFIFKHVFENNPFFSFTTNGHLRAHPDCVVQHHKALLKIQEDWA